MYHVLLLSPLQWQIPIYICNCMYAWQSDCFIQLKSG